MVYSLALVMTGSLLATCPAAEESATQKTAAPAEFGAMIQSLKMVQNPQEVTVNERQLTDFVNDLIQKRITSLPQGEKGEKGEKGDTGPAGPAGPTGSTQMMKKVGNGACRSSDDKSWAYSQLRSPTGDEAKTTDACVTRCLEMAACQGFSSQPTNPNAECIVFFYPGLTDDQKMPEEFWSGGSAAWQRIVSNGDLGSNQLPVTKADGSTARYGVCMAKIKAVAGTLLWTGAAGTAAGQSELIKMPNKEEVCEIYEGNEYTVDISGNFDGSATSGVILTTPGCTNAGPIFRIGGHALGPNYGAQCNVGGATVVMPSIPAGDFRMWITRSGNQYNSFINGVLTKTWTAGWSYGCQDVMIGSAAELPMRNFFPGQISKVAWCSGAHAGGCFGA